LTAQQNQYIPQKAAREEIFKKHSIMHLKIIFFLQIDILGLE
jgi:hypothetical protein